MCGIVGVFSPHGSTGLQQAAASMAYAIAHRGPDGAGVWVEQRVGLALGHRRLSVIDPSPAGEQPMHSACGRYVMVFNGEIYNHELLRLELEKAQQAPAFWRGHSDTETLLACFAAWGVERTLQATVGMFAVALWDRLSCCLTLARDRMGEKPIYWGWNGGRLLFASELKAFKACPGFVADIDRDAIALLLRHACIPAPYCIYAGLHKLCPGMYISLPLGRQDAARAAQPVSYWRLNDAVQSGLASPFSGTVDEAISALDRQLAASVRAQMLSDVPLGAFLSGGVDSTLIVALMQNQSSEPVRTFTIGFDDQHYDEASHARAIAAHLGTQHTELYIEPQDMLTVVGLLPTLYDEPFADSSQIPTYLVSRLARQHVTVALSGDGGDELFGGYNTYHFAPSIWQRIDGLPSSLRNALAAGLSKPSVTAWNRALLPLQRCLPSGLNALSGERLHKLASLLPARSREDFYLRLSSHWSRPESIVLGAQEPSTLLGLPQAWPESDHFEHWMMAMGAQTYMADDILVKVDRASMANSLEVRSPMLDHRLVELAWRMPLDLKIRNGTGKWLLRQVLNRYIPQSLMERPKMGFCVPLAAWLRGPLRDWSEALLSTSRLRNDGYFDDQRVRAAWTAHTDNLNDCSSKLWCVLMFQAWLDEERSVALALAP